MAHVRDLQALKQKLEGAGMPVERVVGGGSYSYEYYARTEGFHGSPGTVTYWDINGVLGKPGQPFRWAALVLCQVVDRYPDQLTITTDLGNKAVAADPRPGAARLAAGPQGRPPPPPERGTRRLRAARGRPCPRSATTCWPCPATSAPRRSASPAATSSTARAPWSTTIPTPRATGCSARAPAVPLTPFHVNWLVHRIHARHVTAAVEAHAGGRLLDVGCGARPFAELLDRHSDRSVGHRPGPGALRTGRRGRPPAAAGGMGQRPRPALPRRLLRHRPLPAGAGARAAAVAAAGRDRPGPAARRRPGAHGAPHLGPPRGASRLLPVHPLRAAPSRRGRGPAGGGGEGPGRVLGHGGSPLRPLPAAPRDGSASTRRRGR